MTFTRCDKCKEEVHGKATSVSGITNEALDLCESCAELLLIWLQTPPKKAT